MAKTYTLLRGPFIHGEKEITEENVGKEFPKLPKSAQQDYLAGGLVAEVPAELLREPPAAATEE
jgi:hypothetical protein